jgi:hypothetical protein
MSLPDAYQTASWARKYLPSALGHEFWRLLSDAQSHLAFVWKRKSIEMVAAKVHSAEIALRAIAKGLRWCSRPIDWGLLATWAGGDRELVVRLVQVFNSPSAIRINTVQIGYIPLS